MHRLIPLIFLVCFVFPVYGDELDNSLLKKADIFLKNGDYAKAEIFYDAYLIENKDCEALFKSGICKINLKKIEPALNSFKKVTKECTKKLEIASNHYLYLIYLELNEPGLALISLNNIDNLSLDPKISELAKYEKIWFYLRFGKTDKAFKEINNSKTKIFDDLKTNEFISGVELLNKNYKSPILAGSLSIIPGGGYFYCNRYKDGLYAFFLNALLISAAYEAFDNDLPVLGTLTGSAASGFYLGNIYGGIRAAQFENRLYKQTRFEKLERDFKKKGLTLTFGFDF